VSDLFDVSKEIIHITGASQGRSAVILLGAFHPSVIPGRAKREPGIHNHEREYGFRACAKWRIPE
jgi:hypothetical protein